MDKGLRHSSWCMVFGNFQFHWGEMWWLYWIDEDTKFRSHLLWVEFAWGTVVRNRHRWWNWKWVNSAMRSQQRQNLNLLRRPSAISASLPKKLKDDFWTLWSLLQSCQLAGQKKGTWVLHALIQNWLLDWLGIGSSVIRLFLAKEKLNWAKLLTHIIHAQIKSHQRRSPKLLTENCKSDPCPNKSKFTSSEHYFDPLSMEVHNCKPKSPPNRRPLATTSSNVDDKT